MGEDPNSVLSGFLDCELLIRRFGLFVSLDLHLRDFSTQALIPKSLTALALFRIADITQVETSLHPPDHF